MRGCCIMQVRINRQKRVRAPLSSVEDRASFLFEYGHGLHKQQQFSKSNRILKEALQRSCDHDECDRQELST